MDHTEAKYRKPQFDVPGIYRLVGRDDSLLCQDCLSPPHAHVLWKASCDLRIEGEGRDRTPESSPSCASPGTRRQVWYTSYFAVLPDRQARLFNEGTFEEQAQILQLLEARTGHSVERE